MFSKRKSEFNTYRKVKGDFLQMVKVASCQAQPIVALRSMCLPSDSPSVSCLTGGKQSQDGKLIKHMLGLLLRQLPEVETS